MLVDGRAERQRTPHLVDPAGLLPVASGLEQSQKRDDRSFAMRDDVDLGRGPLVVHSGQHGAERVENRPALRPELSHDLDVAEVAIEQFPEIEGEEAAPFGQIAQALEH
jgi:hypothetical protein